MQFIEDFTPFTYDDLRTGYEKRRIAISAIENSAHRKIARNYLVHSMLEVAGRYPEILDPELSVHDPEYYFHHTGAHYVGHDAVRSFYHAMTASRSNVIVSTDHHLAVADWGFSLEQVSHFYMPAAVACAKLGFEPNDASEVYVERRPTMRVWPYDEDGRMAGEILYYAHNATYARVSKDQALTPEGVALVLAPLIAICRIEFTHNRPGLMTREEAGLAG